MQELIQIKNIGLHGVNTDVSPWELAPEFITYGFNFRTASGSLVSSGGHEVWSTSPVDFKPGFMIYNITSSSDRWVIAGRDAVYEFSNTSWTDITSNEGYAGVTDELKWNGCALAQYSIINCINHYPEYYIPTLTKCTALEFSPGVTWAQADKKCKVIRNHKNYLFALNLTEGANNYPDGYRWSHPADTNGLPFTWDETDLSSIASRESLGGDGGGIVDGLSLRDSFVIYSENTIDILDMTGDDYVFKRRELSSTAGLLAEGCVVEVKGVHYFLSDGDVYKNDGSNVESIMHDKVRTSLVALSDSNYYKNSFAVKNDIDKEIWFCVPSQGTKYPDLAFIYNWHDSTWAIRDLPENLTHASYGPTELRGSTWAASTGSWDAQTGSWNASNASPKNRAIVGVSTDNTIINLDPSANITTDINAVVERTDLTIHDDRQVTTITRVYPHIKGSQPVKIQFGSQDYAGGPVRWKPAVLYTPGQDRKVDVRTTGEYHAWRISSIGTGRWEFSGMNIEFQLAGMR